MSYPQYNDIHSLRFLLQCWLPFILSITIKSNMPRPIQLSNVMLSGAIIVKLSAVMQSVLASYAHSRIIQF